MKEHSTEIRVRYADTDQMGVMYYSNYLVWFEVARTELFRDMGFEYDKIEKEREICLPVAESYCKYKAPLKYDDVATISASVKKIGNSRLTFEYTITKDGKIVTSGYTSHAFVNKEGRPVPVPADIRKSLEG